MVRMWHAGSKLRVEALEPRWMLDGNVTAQVLGGDLFIRGDSQGNAIQILPAAEVGVYVVEGLWNTTINNQSSPVELRGIRDDFRIDTGSGDDTVILQGKVPLLTGASEVDAPSTGILAIPGDLWIRTFAGHDTVLINGVRVGHSAYVKTYGGDDRVIVGGTYFDGMVGATSAALRNEIGYAYAADVQIAKYLHIDTHDGHDVVGIGVAATTMYVDGYSNGVAPVVDVGRSLFVNTLTGDDIIGIGVGLIDTPQPASGDLHAAATNGASNDGGPVVNVAWDVIVNASTGNNTVGIAVADILDDGLPPLEPYDEIDNTAVTDVASTSDVNGYPVVNIDRSLTVITLTGNDHIGLGINQSFDTVANATSDSANDSMMAELYVKKYVTILTSSGMDYVGIQDAWFGRNLLVDTGLGNDSLMLDSIYVGRNAQLNTSLGNDNVWISCLDVYRGFRLYSSLGNDNISIGTYVPVQNIENHFGIRAKYAKIFTSTGIDNLDIVDSYFADMLYVDLGPDNDTLYAVANSSAVAYLYGGPGEDGVNDNVRTGNSFDKLKIRWFEYEYD